MKTPTRGNTTISGDLPIRSAKPKSDISKMPPQLDVQDATNEQIREATRMAIMNPRLNFSDALAAAIGAKKRTKKRRPKSKRGNEKPTGFEEYYADGPITPKEHAEMLEVYDPGLLFTIRIEEALKRFQYRRRIEPARLNMFLKYLQYGGINIGGNSVGEANKQDVKSMTKDQIMQARARAGIQKERETLEVNFDLVLRGFLSSYFIRYFNPDNEAVIKLATETIKNFYTYLLQRDVCPEYTENLLDARKTCDLAAKELWMNVQLVRKGPGPFNKSCSTLFGGAYFQSTPPTGTECGKDIKEKQENARNVIKYAIAGATSYEQGSGFLELVTQNQLWAKKIHDIDGFEVLAVIDPDIRVVEFYREYASSQTPVGTIKAVSFRDPSEPDIDMSPEERWEWDNGKAPEYEFEFLVDMDLVPLFYRGLKVISGVWQLNCGLYYFDEVKSTYPTFHTVIANGLIMKWKWPRDLTGDDDKKPNEGTENAIQWTVDAASKVTDQQMGEQSDKMRISLQGLLIFRR